MLQRQTIRSRRNTGGETAPAERAPEIDPDARQASETAQFLGISEYRLFEIAWRNWHGEEARPDMLERRFVDWMFGAGTPGYVRHFVRQVRDREAAGTLDPMVWGLDPAPSAALDPEAARAANDVMWATVAAAGWIIFRLTTG